MSIAPLRSADPRGNPLEIPAQIVDRVLPPRSLVLDDALYYAESPGVERRAVVLEGSAQARCSFVSVFGQETADLEFRIRPRLDSPEQLQHVPIATKRDAVRLIGAPAHPLVLWRHVERCCESQAPHASAPRGDCLLRA